MQGASLTAIELCAGVGGQALGFERAGFEMVAVVDIDGDTCSTLARNRPDWYTVQDDLNLIEPAKHQPMDRADVLSCGLPRSPYSIAGKQLATDDRRDTLRATLDVAAYVRPRVLVIENIPTFLTAPKFESARTEVREAVEGLGYEMVSSTLTATDFGVPQERRHGFMVAMHPDDLAHFRWPAPTVEKCPSLGEALFESMSSGVGPRLPTGLLKPTDRHLSSWAEQPAEAAPISARLARRHSGRVSASTAGASATPFRDPTSVVIRTSSPAMVSPGSRLTKSPCFRVSPPTGTSSGARRRHTDRSVRPPLRRWRRR